MASYTTFALWQETLWLALEERNYKSGAFKGQVTPQMSPIDTLKLLLDSSIVTEYEKATIWRPLRDFLKTVGNVKKSSMSQVEKELSNKFEEIFNADKRSRGEYIAPWATAQVVDSGQIKATFEITNDGVKKTKGGVLGRPPSAPADWITANQRPYPTGFGSAATQATAAERGSSSDTTTHSDKSGEKSSEDNATTEKAASGKSQGGMKERENKVSEHKGAGLNNVVDDGRHAVNEEEDTKPTLASKEVDDEDDFGAAFKANIKRRGFF